MRTGEELRVSTPVRTASAASNPSSRVPNAGRASRSVSTTKEGRQEERSVSRPAGRTLFDSLVDAGYLGMRSFDLRQGAIPRVLSDGQLASIRPATLFVVGEDETLYPAHDAIGRLARVAPRVRTELVRGAGHDLTWVKREQVEGVVLDFLR